MTAQARNTDPDTSFQAAQSVDTAYMECVVLDVIKSFPLGCISDDVEDKLKGFRSNTITPRFAPLLRKGLIIDTGERRRARSGRSQRVMTVSSNDANFEEDQHDLG